VCVCFFFSSRRRHTRSYGDWSSDVCSSDLFFVESPNPFHGIHAAVTRRPRTNDNHGWQPEQRMTREEAVRSFTTWNAFASRQERSEERRVGKEWRARW